MSVFMILTVLFCYVCANGTFSVCVYSASKSISFGGVTANPTGSTVDWYYHQDTNKYYLFVPASADLSKLTLYHDFSDEIKIDGNTVKSGDTVSFLQSGGEYTVTAGNSSYTLCVMKANNLPSMFIITESGSLNKIHNNKDYKEAGTMLLVRPDGTTDYNGKLEYIKGRGNTTWNLNKKPYNIKLESSENLLSMGESKRWCLLANAQEPSQLRNKSMYDLADTIDLNYSVKSEFVDLYVNGEYLGVYQLCQKIELGKKDLVKITDLQKLTEQANNTESLETFPQYKSGQTRAYRIPENPADITGGYLLEYNSKLDGTSCFQTKLKQNVDLKSPEYASVEQINYIQNYVQEAEDAVYSTDGYNSQGKYYTDYFDLDSCVKMYLIQELSKNIDSCITSCFFYKDAGGKLTAGPAWDFDVALGNLWGKDANGTYYNLTDPEGLWAAIAPNDVMGNGKLTLFAAMYKHSDFAKRAAEIWQQEFLPAVQILLGEKENTSDSALCGIDDYEAYFSESIKMNYIRWKLTDNLLVNSGTTHEENVSYLKNFVSARTTFLSTSFLPLDEAKEEIKKSLEDFFGTVGNYDTGNDYDKISEIKNKALEEISAAADTEVATEIKNKAIAQMKQYMKVTVYFDNTVVNWETPHIHIWGTETEQASWPGIPMEVFQDDIYTATVPCDASILFNNGDKGEQTVDISNLPTEDSIYIIDKSDNHGDDNKAIYGGSWQTYSQEPSDKTELQALADEAKQYFTEDISNLGKILSDTEAILLRKNISQEKVDAQTKMLKEALDKLKKNPPQSSISAQQESSPFDFSTVIITAAAVSLVWVVVLVLLKKKKEKPTEES